MTPLPDLPAGLAKLAVPTGVHRRWLKILVFGGWKRGKSVFLASFPAPLLAIDCGEGGIGSYLPQDDPNYQCLNVTDPEQFQAAVNWALKHEDVLQSVVVDPITELWTDHMDWFEADLGVEEIKGSQWRQVKSPWKANLRRLMRANFHVGYSAWVKETEYKEDREGVGPGEQGKLAIKAQAIPAIERTVGYTIDMIFEAGVKLGKLNQPTPIHTVTFWGGRRPRSIPPEALFIGKQWLFDSRKPESVWDKVIAPLLPQWENGAAEHLGPEADDPRERAAELAAMDQILQDAEVGRLLRLIAEPYADLAAYRTLFTREIEPAIARLTGENLARVKRAHDERKTQLSKPSDGAAGAPTETK